MPDASTPDPLSTYVSEDGTRRITSECNNHQLGAKVCPRGLALDDGRPFGERLFVYKDLIPWLIQELTRAVDPIPDPTAEQSALGPMWLYENKEQIHAAASSMIRAFIAEGGLHRKRVAEAERRLVAVEAESARRIERLEHELQELRDLTVDKALEGGRIRRTLKNAGVVLRGAFDTQKSRGVEELARRYKNVVEQNEELRKSAPTTATEMAFDNEDITLESIKQALDSLDAYREQWRAASFDPVQLYRPPAFDPSAFAVQTGPLKISEEPSTDVAVKRFAVSMPYHFEVPQSTRDLLDALRRAYGPVKPKGPVVSRCEDCFFFDGVKRAPGKEPTLVCSVDRAENRRRVRDWHERKGATGPDDHKVKHIPACPLFVGVVK